MHCSRVAGPDDRFCGGCGASLTPPCVHCGRAVAFGDAFCTGCGSPLTAPAAAVVHEDRRQVSVLFLDMVGFTTFSEQADPEQVRTLQQEYFATVRQVVRQYGGVVEKYIGDAVMAIFGAPVATETDALRAVRAGLEAQRVLGRGRLAEAVAFRAGVATGEALVDVGAARDGGQAIVAGDVVNTAARLQAAAEPGSVLVCAETARATGDDIEYDERPPQTLRGRTASTRVFLAVAARLRRRDRDESTPMVNRDHERGLLVTALHRTIRDRSTQLVTVFGPAGIGKSRLLRELYRHAERIPDTTVTWRVGHCPPFGENVTFAALAEIVKAQVGILDTDDEATARTRLETALKAMVGELEAARLADALGPLVGLPGAGLSPGETESAWRRFLLAMTTAAPTVLVFEDMHWADEAMLRFVEMLGSIGPGVPLLVVATSRPELRERRPDWTSAVSGAVSVSLGPMHDEHIAAMYRLMFGQAVFPSTGVAPLVELAGGNPLYAHEFVRMLVERGELRPVGANWALADTTPMPQTVQAVIANRLDLLDGTDRAVLQAAAVVGSQFWPGPVAAALNVTPDVVVRSLRRLQQRDIVAEHPTSAMAGEPEYGFRHVLVRDVCYQRLPRAERVSRHQRTADWLEQISDNRATDLAEVLANHRWAAHEIARTLGMDPTPYAQPARNALHRAARRAYALHALDTAAVLVDRALSLKLDADPVLELFAAELALFRNTGAFADGSGVRQLSDLVEELTRAGERAAAARALTLLGTVAWSRADRAATLSYLDSAVERYEELPETLEKAEALLELARVHMMNFETEPALAASEAAADIADRLGLAEARANARITSATTRYQAGDPTGFADLELLTDHCREHRLTSRRRAVQNLAWACLEEGDLTRHYRLLTEQRTVDVAGGLSLATNFYKEAADAYFAGDWATQTRVISETMRTDAAEWDANSVLASSWIRVLRGEPTDDEAIEKVLHLARGSGFHRVLRGAAAHAALCRAMQGRTEQALCLLTELDQDWRARVTLPYGEWAAAAGHAGSLLGTEAAARVRTMLELSPRRTPWVLAALATVSGDHLTAAAHFARIGDASDRALSLSWAARAGALPPPLLTELHDFAARNHAPGLLPPTPPRPTRTPRPPRPPRKPR
ncbi:adenylate/guanylate cyclase domain-containing protein [Catellatospora sp. KI3]|uniref:ATP-binding protein n=1 Tax=Catellatospora sp. KI3 TaxID=3041620 RepID=UPI0024829FC7|nr:adenylate/guanylate cyclase domain-containing protein [Catellatospora sp. KI3]MDI1466351.1 adenylate/guanylate cyclase domain-containing protein [Catellatospora sp. KI3]